MHPAAPQQLAREVVAHDRRAELLLDGLADLLLADAEGRLGLLARLGGGHICLHRRPQHRGEHTLPQVVDIFEGVLCRRKRHKAAERANLGEARKVGRRLLCVRQLGANLVRLLSVEDGKAHRRLQQQEPDLNLQRSSGESCAHARTRQGGAAGAWRETTVHAGGGGRRTMADPPFRRELVCCSSRWRRGAARS